MLIRFLICCLTASILVAACANGDDSPRVTAPADRQSEQSATQQQQRQQQQHAEASPPRQAQTDLEQQQAEPEEPQTHSEQPQTQAQSRPSRPGGPPEPEFDVEIAVGYLNHLADVLGPRASGTEQERAAAEYLAETLVRLGYVVEIQQFDYTTQSSYALLFLPDQSSEYAMHFPGSAAEPVTGELVVVPGYGEQADFDKIEARGRIAIVDRGLIEFSVKAANAEMAGATALIVTNTRPGETMNGTLGTYVSDIPVLLAHSVSRTGLRLRDGEMIKITGASPPDGKSQNVIARKADGTCRVVVGAHYDTVSEVAGANDNASGTALMLALSAIWFTHLAAADICFIGFGAEEVGLHGSDYYVGRLRADDRLSDVTAMLNLDAIGDGRTPYWLFASLSLRDLSSAVASHLGIEIASEGRTPGQAPSDVAPFARAGIPGIFAVPQGGLLHTPLDSLENFDHEIFDEIATFNHALLACLLQRAGSPISPSISCGEEEPQPTSRATLEE